MKIAIATLLIAASLWAGTVHLGWNYNAADSRPEYQTNVGFKIYYSPGDRTVTNQMTVGDVREAYISGLVGSTIIAVAPMSGTNEGITSSEIVAQPNMQDFHSVRLQWRNGGPGISYFIRQATNNAFLDYEHWPVVAISNTNLIDLNVDVNLFLRVTTADGADDQVAPVRLTIY